MNEVPDAVICAVQREAYELVRKIEFARKFEEEASVAHGKARAETRRLELELGEFAAFLQANNSEALSPERNWHNELWSLVGEPK